MQKEKLLFLGGPFHEKFRKVPLGIKQIECRTIDSKSNFFNCENTVNSDDMTIASCLYYRKILYVDDYKKSEIHCYYCMLHEDFDVDKYLLDNPRDFFNKFVVKMTRIKK
jgi:hypothetical protein